MRDNFLNNLGYTAAYGLVHSMNEAQNNAERLYIEEVKKLNVPANAVFFRRFYKEENTDEDSYFSTPAVCIFDKSDSFFNTEEHKILHAALWSAGKIDIYIIIGETRVDIINARRPAKRNGDELTLKDDDLSLVQKAIKNFDDARFSAHLFGSGTFWEQDKLKDKIDSNSNPYTFLLDYLMETRKQLLPKNDKELKEEIIDKLLINSILIKFLEEIKDDNGKHTLKKIYRKYQLKSETFEEALRRGLCVDVLFDLANEFNGQIFNRFSDDELLKLRVADLLPIANFLSADVNMNSRQGFLWKQYSFNHLPAEVISAIYENFIHKEAERNSEKKKDVVYTPLHLVNLLIDESMPLDKPELFKNNTFKVLDPSCGSGVFLVAAYKRMLQWWAINNWKKTGKLAYPDKTVAKKILEKNIFGIDIEEVAALVSIFGLTIAFLDKLTPKEIWDSLKFKDLSKENIQGVNFSNWAKIAKEQGKQFDLVIGNPPFNVSKKEKEEDEDLGDLFKKVPGNKPALKFFEAALYFGKKVCMIIPSNVFLYNKSKSSFEYRREIFTNYTVNKIYDFTHLRRDLFHKTADTPILTILLDRIPSASQVIEHIVVKRQLLNEQKLSFEIDYYDKHFVKWNHATDESKQFVWKTNLLGGGRLFHLIYRMSQLRSLKLFIKETDNWEEARGYEGGKKLQLPGKNVIVDIDNNHNPIIKEKVTVETNKLKDKFLYRPPFVILDQVIGSESLKAAYIGSKQSDKEIYYSRDFIGISTTTHNESKLKKVYSLVINNCGDEFLNYQLFVISISSSCLVLTETDVNKSDFLSLPFPDDLSYLEISKFEKIIQNDVLKYYRHLGKAISKNSAGAILHETITNKELTKFGDSFCAVLNDIYAEDDKSWQKGTITQSPNFISYQFGFGKNGGLQNKKIESSEQDFQFLLNNTTSNSGVIHKRIIRKYKHIDGYDCLYLIKPKTRRYWLQSIALRDADDTFIDLRKAGF